MDSKTDQQLFKSTYISTIQVVYCFRESHINKIHVCNSFLKANVIFFIYINTHHYRVAASNAECKIKIRNSASDFNLKRNI
jgi:hypothetical protein